MRNMVAEKKKRNGKREKIIKKLYSFAFGNANDIVKLALFENERAAEEVSSLDLTMLSEIKRGANGAVEIKLIDRLEVIKLILSELEEDKESAEESGTIITALTAAAEKISSADSE